MQDGSPSATPPDRRAVTMVTLPRGPGARRPDQGGDLPLPLPFLFGEGRRRRHQRHRRHRAAHAEALEITGPVLHLPIISSQPTTNDPAVPRLLANFELDLSLHHGCPCYGGSQEFEGISASQIIEREKPFAGR